MGVEPELPDPQPPERDHRPIEGMFVSRVLIERRLTDDGDDVIWSYSYDSDGDDLPLLEALGLLEFAKNDLIQSTMAGSDDGGDEE
jgi:hypothetical protein